MSTEITITEPADGTILADSDLTEAWRRDDRRAEANGRGDQHWFALDDSVSKRWLALPYYVQNGVRLVVAGEETSEIERLSAHLSRYYDLHDWLNAQIERGIAITEADLAEQLAKVNGQSSRRTPEPSKVVASDDAWWCPKCHGHYVRPYHEHAVGCPELEPVTITITRREVS